MTAVDRLILLSDAETIMRDAIEKMVELNDHRNPEDAITDAIRKAEDIQGDLWKAAALVESEAAVETMRDEARNLAWYRSGT